MRRGVELAEPPFERPVDRVPVATRQGDGGSIWMLDCPSVDACDHFEFVGSKPRRIENPQNCFRLAL